MAAISSTFRLHQPMKEDPSLQKKKDLLASIVNKQFGKAITLIANGAQFTKRSFLCAKSKHCKFLLNAPLTETQNLTRCVLNS